VSYGDPAQPPSAGAGGLPRYTFTGATGPELPSRIT
jgi:hypothetical protein